MLTKNKFIFISIISFIITCLAISSYQSIIAGYVCFALYVLIIVAMLIKRLKYNKMVAYNEQQETREKYKSYKAEQNSKND